MCVVSMVFDHYQQPFNPWVDPGAPPVRPWPSIPVSELDEIRKLIKEFREAVAAARRVDVLTKQPDCEDPKKAALEKRVDELERQLRELKK